MKLRRSYLPILSILLLISPAAAQEDPEAAAEATETYVIPADHDSARSTMRTFLESFDPARRDPSDDPLDVAADCLDLSEIRQAIRGHQGRELALQLKEVLDRTEFIVVDSLPDAADAPPYRLDVYDHGQVVIAPDARGEWLFDAETVREIPRLLAAVRDRAIVEGATKVERLPFGLWLQSKMPEALRGRALWIEHWQWLFLVLLLVAGLIVDRLVAGLGRSVAGNYLSRHLVSIEPPRLKRALRPMGLFAASLFWWFGIYRLALPPGALDVLRYAAHFVVAAAFVWAAYRLVDVFAVVMGSRARDTGNKFDDLLVPLVRKVLKVAIAGFGLLFIAQTLEWPVGSILAGLGIGGLAVALAAQDLVKNLFGSLLVIADQPFSVGDYVKVGSVDGTVEELGFRSTRLRTPQNSLVTLPNSHLITTSVDNLGARTFRRWKTTLSLTYDTPPDKIEAFCEGVRELIRQHPHTRKEAFYVHFVEFSPSSLDVLMQLHFDVPDWTTELESKQQLGLDVLRLAEELGVEMAFPTQTVHLQGGAGS